MASHDVTPAAAQDPEALLVQRAKERSPDAWTEIYDTYYPRLFRYCYARTSDEATAAELTSQVYLEALDGIDQYVYRGRPLLAWLYRIARNLVSDHLGKRQREAKAFTEAGSILERNQPGPASTVDDRYDLEAALHQLSEDHQQVLALRYYSDLSTAEIAQAMGRSERAVYSLEVRALTALRRLFEPHR
jgi:RNA polymerase sigma-70 factor (ECF subfamily)